MRFPFAPNAALVASLWRRATWSVAFEAPLLGVIAATIIFFGGLATKGPVDGATWFANASFSNEAIAASGLTGGGHVALVFPRFPVVSAADADQGIASTPDLQTVELDVVADLRTFSTDVLGNNVESESATGDAFVDEDTARHLHIGPGDAVVLDLNAVGGSSSPKLIVAGLLRPYASPYNHGDAGLVVVGQPSLPSNFPSVASNLMPSGSPPNTVYFNVDPGFSGSIQTRPDKVQEFVGELLGRDAIAAVLGVFGFAGLLWLAAAWRGLDHIRRRMRQTAAILVAIGAGPAEISKAIVIPAGLMLLAAQLAGALLTASAVFPTLLMVSLQPLAVLPLFALISLGSVGLLVVLGRSVRRDISTGQLVATLSANE